MVGRELSVATGRMARVIEMTREQVLAHRVSVQQLARAPVPGRVLTDAAIFDLGVQDSGRDGASWALANRGVPIGSPATLYESGEVALVWTLRASPHFYRRTELPEVLTATSPLSEADAAKRLVAAAKPLTEAGIGVREGLAEMAAQLRQVVDRPRAKGEVSTLLSPRLAPPYLRECRPCRAVHAWEVPFRMGTLYGGLELQPGTSPPLLQRISDWPHRRPGPAADPMVAPEHLQPVRGYLRLLGPATPPDVAAFLDGSVQAVKAHWPKDAIPVRAGGRTAWLLGEPQSLASEPVRLLGPFDLFLQARDRQLLVPDARRRKVLWPVLGRPGAILSGAELVGVWRPTAAAGRFSLRVGWWGRVSAAVRAKVDVQAARLAQHRGLAFAGVEEELS